MQILKSENKIFIEFVKKPIDLKIQFNVDDLLKINFNFDKKIKMYNWIILMIKSLICISINNIYVFLFHKWNKKTKKLNNQKFNFLSINIIELKQILNKIFCHFFHMMIIDRDMNDKIFCCQFVKFHNFHEKKKTSLMKKIFIWKKYIFLILHKHLLQLFFFHHFFLLK